MGLGTFSPVGDFKGHKVKRTMAFAGLGAPSAITFKPTDTKMPNLGNQSISANLNLWWKDMKFGIKKLAKFGQLGPNLGQKYISLKKSNKMVKMHGKLCQ